MFGNVRIHRAQRIIQQVEIRLSINRSREINSRSLASGQRYTSVSNYRHVALWQLSEILGQGTYIRHLKSPINCQKVLKNRDIIQSLYSDKNLCISRSVVRLAKQDVVPHGAAEEPGFLTGVGNT